MRNLALAVVSVVVTLAALEGACRLFASKSMDKTSLDVGWASIKGLGRTDPVLGYTLTPGRYLSEYSINSLGYRAFEFSPQKPANTYRVLCIGGSTTIGSNAGHNRYTYPAILNDFFREALRGTGKRVEVINGGVFGYHSWHSVIRVAAERKAVSPDMYVVMDGINDVMAAYNTPTDVLARGSGKNEALLDGLVNKGGAKGSASGTSLMRWLGQSALYSVTARIVPEILSSTGLFDAMLQRKLDLFGYTRNMERLITDNRAHGVETLLVNYPWIVRPDSTPDKERGRIPFPLEDAHYAVYLFGRKAIARDNQTVVAATGVPYVDPQPLFDKLTMDPAAIRDYYSDSMHFSRYGNFILAKAVYRKLSEDPGLQRFLGRMRLPSADELAERFPALRAWPALRRQPDAKWKLLAFAPAMVVEAADNIRDDMDGAWTVSSPADLDKPAHLVLRFLEKPHVRDDVLVALPRAGSAADTVTIASPDGQGSAPKSLLAFHGNKDGGWTPIGFEVPVKAGPDGLWPSRLVVTLSGKGAQIWRYGSRLLFPDYLLAGP